MTDLSTPTPERRFRTGRKPMRPEGERLAIKWLHEYDPEVAPDVPVSYPVNVLNDISSFPMWGNGPDPTLTIDTAASPPAGAPVGDCFFAGVANDEFVIGNPKQLSSNGVVGTYDAYEADSQGVPAGQEQDEGVVMADALLWCLTHDFGGNKVPQGQGIVQLFAPVHPDTLGQVMTKYQRGILLGVNLTDQDENTFPSWNESPSNPPDPNEGHVVYLGKLNGPIGQPSGSGGPVSWEQVVDASATWMAKCPEEWWILLTSADLAKMGVEAFDALAADLAALPSAEGTVPAEPEPAPPTPEPAPVDPPEPEPVPVDPPTPTPEPTPVPPAIPPAPPAAPPGIHQWITELKAWVTAIEGWVITTFGQAEE